MKREFLTRKRQQKNESQKDSSIAWSMAGTLRKVLQSPEQAAKKCDSQAEYP
jgi:hypothetical protein